MDDTDEFLDELGLGTDEAEQPSVCMDTTKDAAAPTRLDITGSVSVRSTTSAGGATTEDAKKKRGGSKVSRTRMSATDEAYRDTARSTIPAPASERMLTAESTSFVTADPTRGEEKRTLSSAATSPGVPLSEADLISKGKEVPRRSRRSKRRSTAEARPEGGRRKKRTKRPPPEPVVHRVADIAPEALVEDEAMQDAREIEKHPGKVKTADIGVAVPHPGDRESQLRTTLDASALTRKDVAAAEAPAPALKKAEPGAWETTSVPEIAKRLDERRMGVGKASEASDNIQPSSQLKTALANHNRITLDQLRVGISTFFQGVLDDRLMEVQAASQALRESSTPRDRAQSLRVPNTASPASNGGGARRGQKTLILDDSEEAIHGLFRKSIPPAPGLVSSFVTKGEGDPETLCLPRLGLGRAVDMPLDEAELAVLRGGSTIREAMVYFMSFDDSVAAMTSTYKTACKMASMVEMTDALHPQNGAGDAVRRCFIKRLRERERELDRKWEASGAQDSKLWMERFATRVLSAILTGELREQRHNIVRTLVAKEEGLLELYREPAQRCFLDGGEDTEVIARIRRLTAQFGDIAAGDGEIPSTVLPRMGTPASKAYCADFLRAPDPENSLERPCARGERNCVAWLAASQPSWPSTGALNRGARAFVMREFHSPDAWQQILQSKTLPAHRGNCLMCSRHTTTYMYVQLRLLDTCSIIGIEGAMKNQAWRGMLLGQSHSNAIDDEGGYSQSDMIPMCLPTDGPWTGIVAPIVQFRANSYVLSETVVQPREAREDAAPPTKTLPCFFERTAADFR